MAIYSKIFYNFLFWALLVLLFLSCKNESQKKHVYEQKAKKSVLSSHIKKPAKKIINTCLKKIKAFKAKRKDERLENYYKNLPYILIHTTNTPVIYLDYPQISSDAEAQTIIEQLLKHPRRKTIRKIKKQYGSNKTLMREVFLRDGYFFCEQKNLCYVMANSIFLSDLFDEPVIYFLREKIFKLIRKGDSYWGKNGEKFSLLLNDRVAKDPEVLKEPKHLELNVIRKKTGALRVIKKAVSDDMAHVDLIFPDSTKIEALIAHNGTDTILECVFASEEKLKNAKNDAKKFWNQHEKLIEAAKKMVKEKPFFDEPKDEADDVQEDGKLRMAWKGAYYARQKTFFFREVEYPVFDRRGYPIVPQVCIDFVFDTWERALGNWYRRKGKRPGREKCAVDLSIMDGLNKRHIPSLLAFAEENPNIIERYDIPHRDWKPYKKLTKFSSALSKHTRHFREGDVLIIHGLREEDLEEHYHSVIILRTDPLTGMPMQVTGNAGKPRIWHLGAAMRKAPRRSIKHRLRISLFSH